VQLLSVQRDGKFDFASDEKREKRVARKMILFPRFDSTWSWRPSSTNRLPPGRHPSKRAPARRRGSSARHAPRSADSAPLGEMTSEAEKSGGAIAGLAKFKELRAKFYGGQQYDFTEYALVGIATTALNANGRMMRSSICRRTSNTSPSRR